MLWCYSYVIIMWPASTIARRSASAQWAIQRKCNSPHRRSAETMRSLASSKVYIAVPEAIEAFNGKNLHLCLITLEITAICPLQLQLLIITNTFVFWKPDLHDYFNSIERKKSKRNNKNIIRKCNIKFERKLHSMNLSIAEMTIA